MPSGVPRNETLLRKYPGLTVEQARRRYHDEMRANARLGGSARVPKGFAVNPELARLAGEKGRKMLHAQRSQEAKD